MGVKKVEEAIETLSQLSDENFSLFKYCSMASAEVEDLTLQLTCVRKEFERSKNNKRHCPHKRKALQLKQKQSHIIQKTKNCKKRTLRSQETIRQFKTAIKSMFRAINCTIPQESQYLGEAFFDSNIIQCIAIIEKV